jgi:hypothetical protein
MGTGIEVSARSVPDDHYARSTLTVTGSLADALKTTPSAISTISFG